MSFRNDVNYVYAQTAQVERLARIYKQITGVDILSSESELLTLQQRSDITCLERDLLKNIAILNEIKGYSFDPKNNDPSN